MALMADFFIEDLVKTIIDRTLPNMPKMPMVTRTGPYITSLKSSAPYEISSKIISQDIILGLILYKYVEEHYYKLYDLCQ